MPLPRLLRQCLDLPTAPFREEHVLDFVRERCGPLKSVSLSEDRCGNLIAHYRRGPRVRRSAFFAAHTDHPGFVVRELNGDGTFSADFRGGVAQAFFDGAKARFFVNGKQHRAAIKVEAEEKVKRGSKVYIRPTSVRFKSKHEIPVGAIGMWDLPDAAERNANVRARACDDIAGVAALLALLENAEKKRLRADFRCMFSRAEEVGFVGAVGAIKAKSIPKDAFVIVVETSSELAHVRIGDGPVIRVGDKATVFNPDVTAYCERVAQERAKKKRSFQFQRKLMDGGTCEATAFNAMGYDATCICLVLGNYHNMNRKTGKIDSEYVSISDWRLMVDWFADIAANASRFREWSRHDPKPYEKLFSKYRKLL